ncbi:MAG: M24 family metallopeptidase [Xanthobacteraceae bacterium]|jgi:Xaa-Pro aminopeptidase
MVKMASKLSFGTAAADWQERINVARMRDERAERTRKFMRKYGIPALLAARPDNTRYLTGIRGAEFMPQLWYVLFFAEHDPVVFAHAGWHRQLPAAAPWIKHWRVARAWLAGIGGPEVVREEGKIFADQIVEELKARGLLGEKLGLLAMDGVAQQALSAAGIKTVDYWPMMLETRATKTVDEINCLKTVASICEATWHRIWREMKPGMNDTELSRISVDELIKAGSDEARPIYFMSGPLTFERGFDRPSRMIQTGDLVYAAMCGIGYLGYRSCNYRTFKVGRTPSAKEKDWYKRVLDSLDGIIDAAKPGASTADLAMNFPPASSWGYKDEAEVLTMEIGHGIGISLYEYPVINRQWSLKHPQILQAGMTFAVESREGREGEGGVRLENMVVVTETGAEVMDHFPRDEVLTAPA